ncbi:MULTISPECIES: sulfatase-like hydrolase/transferase [unclassified Oceanispirochaeta]|uniref:sulfatase-like hydrolase/transferase n=1 Tax=unclassified Oceanispirochaeta TaxID=2635722 RepID=UPI000E092ED9|nr:MULTISPECIES: sulfatase-like hydrolase/transferase [unclassified Oceanispirochaeta]MBF9017882.1 sulfatase-like hydrolase/transferase [Oceanispirochaeta sp. M2]NPD74393.1 sulfatase-like hydrolase/transferase [Oceanispirochaeta sp. M1]RDG29778.1 arylsulfatase [Oceanispirochaeta sp. M1]
MNKKPNIVFFFVDQQRWDTCGCYGQKDPITPHLDQMASEGVLFENAFTCQPVCGPARACLQTGKWATELGCYRNGIRLPSNEKTIAHHFSEEGYNTAYIGKWHLASDDKEGLHYEKKAVPPELRGGWDQHWIASDVLEFTSRGYGGHMFDTQGNKKIFPKGRYRVDTQTDWALEYLDSQKNEENPFILFLSYIEPHHQNDRFSYEGPKGSKKRFKDFNIPDDLAGKRGNWKRSYPDYLGCINSLDENLGRIRSRLNELGMSEDTLIVYTSDHGSHFKTRNSEYKRSCHDASIHIPLVIMGPGFKGGKRMDELVSLIDLPPTLLNAAGRKVPGHMAGRPLSELTNSAKSEKPWPEEVFYQISESQVGRGIRTSKWKYSVKAPKKNGWKLSSSESYESDFLYDLEKDPHELNNLADSTEHKGVREELSEILIRRMVDAGENAPRIDV